MDYGFTPNQLDKVLETPSHSTPSDSSFEPTLRENKSSFKYEPQSYNFPPIEETVKKAESVLEKTTDANKGMKTIAAMSLLSIGFYTVLRSVGKRN